MGMTYEKAEGQNGSDESDPYVPSRSNPYKIRLSAHIRNKQFYALFSAYFKK